MRRSSRGNHGGRDRSGLTGWDSAGALPWALPGTPTGPTPPPRGGCPMRRACASMPLCVKWQPSARNSGPAIASVSGPGRTFGMRSGGSAGDTHRSHPPTAGWVSHAPHRVPPPHRGALPGTPTGPMPGHRGVGVPCGGPPVPCPANAGWVSHAPHAGWVSHAPPPGSAGDTHPGGLCRGHPPRGLCRGHPPVPCPANAGWVSHAPPRPERSVRRCRDPAATRPACRASMQFTRARRRRGPCAGWPRCGCRTHPPARGPAVARRDT